MPKASFKLLRRAVRMYNEEELGQMLWCKRCSGDLNPDGSKTTEEQRARVTLEDRIKAGLRVIEARGEIVCRCTRRVIV